MIGTILYTALSTNNAVKAIVGTNVFPVLVPQEIKGDSIAYALTANLPDETKDARSSLDTYSFDVFCVSKGYKIVDDLSVTVRTALEALTGTTGVQSCRYQTERDDFDAVTTRFIRIVSFKLRKTR